MKKGELYNNPFQPKDTIKAINKDPLPGNDQAPHLQIDKAYTAETIYKCACGQEHIDVGLKSRHNWIKCYCCDNEIPQGNSIYWCHPSRFVKA